MPVCSSEVCKVQNTQLISTLINQNARLLGHRSMEADRLLQVCSIVNEERRILNYFKSAAAVKLPFIVLVNASGLTDRRTSQPVVLRPRTTWFLIEIFG